jgi:thiamine-phosphate pyrophosphorylase
VDNPIIGVSCHTVAEVRLAEAHGADFAVFGPVFEKGEASATEASEPASRPVSRTAFSRTASSSKGRLPELRQAGGMVDRRPSANPAGKMPVLALGGITLQNAQKCIAAGAAGIAAIRLFQENDIERIVTKLQAG